jgi:hypothetical protein
MVAKRYRDAWIPPPASCRVHPGAL